MKRMKKSWWSCMKLSLYNWSWLLGFSTRCHNMNEQSYNMTKSKTKKKMVKMRFCSSYKHSYYSVCVAVKLKWSVYPANHSSSKISRRVNRESIMFFSALDEWTVNHIIFFFQQRWKKATRPSSDGHGAKSKIVSWVSMHPCWIAVVVEICTCFATWRCSFSCSQGIEVGVCVYNGELFKRWFNKQGLGFKWWM